MEVLGSSVSSAPFFCLKSIPGVSLEFQYIFCLVFSKQVCSYLSLAFLAALQGKKWLDQAGSFIR